jgi:hypothetical protein
MLLRMWGQEKEPSYTVGGNVNYIITMENNMETCKKNLKLKLPYDSAVTILRIY